MSFSATAVLYGRDFKVYTVAWSASNTLPANTVLYGTDWSTPSGQSSAWVEVGYTDGGLDFSAEVTRGEIRVDQAVDPIATPATGRNITLATNLAEFTPLNIKNAAGQGTVTTLAATTAVRGYNDLDVDSTIADAFRSIGYDIQHPGDSEAFRIVGWKTIASGAVSGKVNPEDNATISLSARCFPDTSTTPARVLKIRDLIAIG